MTIHTLKTDPIPFADVLGGAKRFEIRKDDRGFAVGDILDLRATVSTGAQMAAGAPLEYTGRELSATVTHLMHGPAYGLADGWVIMSIIRRGER
jgi:hypothetical protein